MSSEIKLRRLDRVAESFKGLRFEEPLAIARLAASLIMVV